MSGKATIEIIGRVAVEPEMRFTGDGKAVTTLKIPVQERRDGETTWFKCVAWEKQAETLNQYASKGTWLVIRGTPKIESWEDKNSGETRSQLVVTIREFTFAGGGSESDNASEPTQNTPARPATQQKPAQRATAPSPARNMPQRIDDSSDLPF